MDDDDDRDFSKGIVYGFFEQADGTFEKMEKAMYAIQQFITTYVTKLTSNRSQEDLKELSQLGHFLKGSSATLGLTKVKEACEKIQHYGARKDETGTINEPDEKVSLENIKKTLADVKEDYTDVETLLRRFYGEDVSIRKKPAFKETTTSTDESTPASKTEKEASK